MLEPAHLPREVVGQQVELHPPLGRHLVGDLLTPLVARVAGSGLELLEAEALLGQDLLELLGDLAVGATEVTALELLLPLDPEPVEELAQALDLVAVGGLPAAVEHPLERLVEVAVGQEVIGELGQDGVGVVDQRLLGAVPAAVGVPPGHPRPR